MRRALATLVGARGTVPPVTPPSADSDATARYRQRVATGESSDRAALAVGGLTQVAPARDPTGR